MKLKYLKSDYVPKGDLEGFPLEVIDKMIERQVEQGNIANVEVFETRRTSDDSYKGFYWETTEEGCYFWTSVIDNKNFDLFFEKYPKEEEKTFPRIIEVYHHLIDDWIPRVCIKVVDGEAVCWKNAHSFEEAEKATSTKPWTQWQEVQEEPKEEYKPFDFSDGVVNHKDLIGKTLFSKDGKQILFIVDLWYQNVNDNSFINDIDTEHIFENYTFENGEPVGIKIEKNEES